MADKEKVEIFVEINETKFRKEDQDELRETLLSLDKDTFQLVCDQSYDSPHTMFLVSLFLGRAGIDRLLLGDKKKALIKFLTQAAFGIWHIIDLVHIMDMTRDHNMQKVRDIARMKEKPISQPCPEEANEENQKAM